MRVEALSLLPVKVCIQCIRCVLSPAASARNVAMNFQSNFFCQSFINTYSMLLILIPLKMFIILILFDINENSYEIW